MKEENNLNENEFMLDKVLGKYFKLGNAYYKVECAKMRQNIVEQIVGLYLYLDEESRFFEINNSKSFPWDKDMFNNPISKNEFWDYAKKIISHTYSLYKTLK